MTDCMTRVACMEITTAVVLPDDAPITPGATLTVRLHARGRERLHTRAPQQRRLCSARAPLLCTLQQRLHTLPFSVPHRSLP